MTFAFFAVATGVGGGTVRDLLIGAPVFWTRQNATLGLCLGAAMLVWITPVRFWTSRVLLWCDALGLAAFSTYGVAKALAFGIAPIPALLMGVFTACLGGIIRDMLAGEPSIIMRSELVSPSFPLFPTPINLFFRCWLYTALRWLGTRAG